MSRPDTDTTDEQGSEPTPTESPVVEALRFADVASAPWKAVWFDCGHRAWLYPEEYGDGSGWCEWCDRLETYDVGEAFLTNGCAECGYEHCGPASCCAACGHMDWREEIDYDRKPIGDETWRLALCDDTWIASAWPSLTAPSSAVSGVEGQP